MIELIRQFDQSLMKTLVDIEDRNFAGVGLNEWTLVPFIRHGRVFIIHAEDDIAGMIQYMLDWENTRKAYLLGVSICENVRNRGLGTALVKESMDHLRREGIHEVELTVSPDNKPAIAIYQEKLGFVVAGYREDEYGPGQHRLVMRCQIPDHPAIFNGGL